MIAETGTTSVYDETLAATGQMWTLCQNSHIETEANTVKIGKTVPSENALVHARTRPQPHVHVWSIIAHKQLACV